jgi:multidrug efflux pump subunit AcrA (membrane-fusion protein)
MAAIHEQSSNLRDPEWIEFESLLGELAELAKSGLPFEQLAKLLLEKTVQLLAAAGGAVWRSDHSSPLRLECQVNHDAIGSAISQGFHQQLLESALAEGNTIVVPPGGITAGGQSLANPTEFTLLIGPLKVDQDVVGLFEVIQRASLSPAAMRGSRRLLGLICELAADHLRRDELRQLRDEQMRMRHLEYFTERIHGTLEVRTVAYELANAGRQFIDCDRVSVAIRKGRHFVLKAISSVDSINRRSNVVRRLEQLADRVARANEPVWYHGEGTEEIAPQILESLRLYADEAHPRSIGLIPLGPPSADSRGERIPPAGVLVVEQFTSVLDESAGDRAETVAKQTSLALVNSLRYESLPTLPFARRRNKAIGQPAFRLSTMLLVLAGIAAVASLFFIRIDFNVHAQGELQPEQQQYVFAPFDGQVASIAVKHGDIVAANDVLLELRSPELDLESQRIQGEVDTTQKRISAIESSLLQLDVSDQDDENRFTQLAAEQEELIPVLASQQEQLALLRQQREKLVLRSPIAGQILTWDLEQLLSDRPVQRGQSLLNVANLDGSWLAELEVPDDKIGHVLGAKTTADPLPVTFQLATDRGTDFRGTVRRIASRTETTKEDRAAVLVTMDVDEQSIRDLRPGATILAKIQCGKRSIAYVLFHDLVETALSWLRF